MGQQYGMLGQTLGQMGQLAAPTYWEPTYVYEEDKPGWLRGALGGAFQGGLAGLMSGNPLAALAGAGAGGLMGGLGLQDSGYGTGMLAAGGLMEMGDRYGWWPQDPEKPVYEGPTPSDYIPAWARAFGGQGFGLSGSPGWNQLYGVQ
jgi:hypothetical protein